MTPKEKAIGFLTLVTTGKIDEAYEKYIAPDFKHHNPYTPGSREALKQGMKDNDGMFPDKNFEVKRVLEDGDLVATHSYLKLKADLELAVVHIFRFKDGLVAELWDLGQPVQKDSPNENGMF